MPQRQHDVENSADSMFFFWSLAALNIHCFQVAEHMTSTVIRLSSGLGTVEKSTTAWNSSEGSSWCILRCHSCQGVWVLCHVVVPGVRNARTWSVLAWNRWRTQKMNLETTEIGWTWSLLLTFSGENMGKLRKIWTFLFCFPLPRHQKQRRGNCDMACWCHSMTLACTCQIQQLNLCFKYWKNTHTITHTNDRNQTLQ